MPIVAERIDHAISRLRGNGEEGAKIASFLERRAETAPQCEAHPTELPSLLIGVREDGFLLVCASCIPAEARTAVTFVGHELLPAVPAPDDNWTRQSVVCANCGHAARFHENKGLDGGERCIARHDPADADCECPGYSPRELMKVREVPKG